MKYLDSDGLLYFTQKIKTWLSGKVDKVDGKGLSTNDFTTTLKNKLDGISAGANVNVQADWNATSGDAFIKNKPTIPAGAKLYSSTGQNTDGAMTQKATTDAINTAIGGITQIDVQVVTSLPTTGTKGVIYLKAHSHGTGDAYDEYIWTGSAFEKIGNTDIDLSGYVPTTRKVNGKALSNDITIKGIDILCGSNFSSSLTITDVLAAHEEEKLDASSLTAITNAEIDTICS